MGMGSGIGLLEIEIKLTVPITRGMHGRSNLGNDRSFMDSTIGPIPLKNLSQINFNNALRDRRPIVT